MSIMSRRRQRNELSKEQQENAAKKMGIKVVAPVKQQEEAPSEEPVKEVKKKHYRG
jgi:hypothetical protein